jgi:hypothetical protein
MVAAIRETKKSGLEIFDLELFTHFQLGIVLRKKNLLPYFLKPKNIAET